MTGKTKIFTTISVIVILLFSVFVGMIFSEVRTISAKIEEKKQEPLFVKIYADQTTGIIPF